ncbi:MAG: MFS transporter [Gammaproteobacteria bacterium]|jgi:NNP family nitrate/nitrite transporter-like MFS transporter|nr:MFS transporter [Gammaproteobacteria bacterium]MBP6050791.1 MFS transporter [Pseudomonadales bacterium]MBK6584421.1 MFS transporter [Gammaproteobacteria bacterium]MBK7520880.1 MFS transporter [Gammaproteobacteria bacterium]MBK7727875.1 MFS transporter [Gammaproteobacteria bacterium]
MVGEVLHEGRTRALSLSTVAFTVCFAVWTIFSIIGIQIKQNLGLSETQFGLLVGTPILTGSLVRIVLGVWADRYGGHKILPLVMIAAGIATWALVWAETYTQFLLVALGVGLAGGSFAVGIAYVSRWYPASKQGTALGIFGAGNVGAAVTKFCAPFLMVAAGWEMVAQVWAVVIVVTGVLFFFLATDDPVVVEQRRKGITPRSAWLELEPLKNVQVWRFSLYYFFVFGAFVALALTLPHYLIGVYGLDIRSAGMIGALYSIPASIFRAYGGHLSDQYGARRIMYWTFGVSLLCCFLLSYPPTQYVVRGIDGPISFTLEMGLPAFIVLIFVLGFFMSLGKAAVYKHIPVYFPKNVGAVGGLVGMIGGLGGFLLPIAFGALNDLTGVWSSSFMLLFLIVAVSTVWMHVSVRSMERAATGTALEDLPAFPELQDIHVQAQPEHRAPSHVLSDWRPEDPAFWQASGRSIARRNLLISIPALLLSFAVWMVWSAIVAKLPLIGFAYTTDQLFWLAALPGVSGATLRIFYSFTIPIFGGRMWTTLATWSLLIPALGIGYAVRDPGTPYAVFLGLALACGLGGGNFASSMSNISFFYPKAEKGHVLALNAGLGNLGVSVVQFVVPMIITAGVFGALGGAPQTVTQNGETSQIWLQNAGFIWVPFIIASAFAAWFGMNDVASAKASFADQAVIFRRMHNWIMCWLYTGTFGSFIGFSAGFPLLAKVEFPEVIVLKYAFLGPLVGALSRSLTGGIADRYGGGRVTLWVFVGMMAGVCGVLYFLGIKEQDGAFWGFFASFLFLFFVTGVGNASTFQMIPAIMRKEVAKLCPGLSPAEQQKQSDKESAAIIGFTSAIAAYGAFFIPKSYGTAIALTGKVDAALHGFLLFYASCLFITWYCYTRRGALLWDVERRVPAESGDLS